MTIISTNLTSKCDKALRAKTCFDDLKHFAKFAWNFFRAMFMSLLCVICKTLWRLALQGVHILYLGGHLFKCTKSLLEIYLRWAAILCTGTGVYRTK